MVKTDIATSDSQFEQILSLQQQYSQQVLTPRQQQSEGFVFLQHTLPLLKKMAAKLPQAIALQENQIVGYCLSLSLSLQSSFPRLEPMFDQFTYCRYREKRLADYCFFVGGQVCVDRDFRGQGISSRLYNHIRRTLSAQYELCVTEVSTRKQASVHAHKKMGFETILTYSDDNEQWKILAWNLQNASRKK